MNFHTAAVLPSNSDELIHMYIAGYMVTGFLLAGWYAFCRLRGRWGATSAPR